MNPLIHLFAPDPTGMPATIGVPFPRGMVREAGAISVVAPSGTIASSSARSLVNWPDGSVRWALLAITAKESGAHRIELGGAQSHRNGDAVRLESSAGKILLSNGLVEVTLVETGPGPIHSLKAQGHTYISQPEDLRLRVDGADSAHETRRTIKVLEESSTRARVRIEGAHFDASGKRRLNYRLDVELWAGWPTLRLDYHFFHLEPKQAELDIEEVAMDFSFALGPQTSRRFLQSVHGHFYVPREVVNPAKVALVADDTCAPPHVEDPAMLLDDVEYPPFLHPPLDGTEAWLGIGDGQRAVFARMQDFAAMRPKRLVSDGNRLSLEVWPRRAGKLQLPQGRSRRQTLTLAFSNQPAPAREWIDTALAAPLAEGRACIDPQWLAHCGEFEQDRVLRFGKNSRFEKYLRRLMHVSMPQTMFDLGDTVDSHYLRTYISVGGLQERLPGAPEIPRVFLASGLLAEWSQPETYEPVWTNNEYDLIHAFCCEIMRTGRPELWTLARWAVRHNIEVDFVHYHDDRWQNRATPAHSARHTTTGAYPSHFWTQGLLEYYCLTGDADALEFAVALGDKIIENFSDPARRETLWGFNREVGWPVLALSHLGDITGEPRFRKQLDDIVNFLIAFDFRGQQRTVNLSGVNPRHRFIRQVASAFFGYASMMEGVDHYARWSGRADLGPWLTQILGDLHDALRQSHLEGDWLEFRHMHAVGMAIGFERTGDEKFLRLGLVCLQEFMDSPAWIEPVGEAKPTAMTHRALVRFLFHAERAGLLDKLDYLGLRDGDWANEKPLATVRKKTDANEPLQA